MALTFILTLSASHWFWIIPLGKRNVKKLSCAHTTGKACSHRNQLFPDDVWQESSNHALCGSNRALQALDNQRGTSGILLNRNIMIPMAVESCRIECYLYKLSNHAMMMQKAWIPNSTSKRSSIAYSNVFVLSSSQFPSKLKYFLHRLQKWTSQIKQHYTLQWSQLYLIMHWKPNFI